MTEPITKLTLDELRTKLHELGGKSNDPPEDHRAADNLLLDYIGDDEVREAFDAILKFYE